MITGTALGLLLAAIYMFGSDYFGVKVSADKNECLALMEHTFTFVDDTYAVLKQVVDRLYEAVNDALDEWEPEFILRMPSKLAFKITDIDGYIIDFRLPEKNLEVDGFLFKIGKWYICIYLKQEITLPDLSFTFLGSENWHYYDNGVYDVGTVLNLNYNQKSVALDITFISAIALFATALVKFGKNDSADKLVTKGMTTVSSLTTKNNLQVIKDQVVTNQSKILTNYDKILENGSNIATILSKVNELYSELDDSEDLNTIKNKLDELRNMIGFRLM